jgi:hypothetical protein
MELAVLLSVAASFVAATSSVRRRQGPRTVTVTGFDPWLVFRLARPGFTIGDPTTAALLGVFPSTREVHACLPREVDGHAQAPGGLAAHESEKSQRMAEQLGRR